MALPATPFTPLADFHWMLETQPNARMEWVNGEIVAMGKTSKNHTYLAERLSVLASGALYEKGCKVSRETMAVGIMGFGDDALFFPDLVVACGKNEFDPNQPGDVLTNPTAIVEILSPGTRSYDLKTKVPIYQQVPSLQLIWLVEQEPYKLIEYRRLMVGNQWVSREMTDADARLDFLGIEFTLGDVYAYVVV